MPEVNMNNQKGGQEEIGVVFNVKLEANRKNKMTMKISNGWGGQKPFEYYREQKG